ncbi:MAG: hypothetical protein ACXWQO_00900 [Bdellovibrionota bacterium]
MSASAGKTETLWKEWYLYSAGGKPAGFYEETAEKRLGEKQIAVTQRWVEREGTLSETYIGAVADDDGKFTPVAFFRERKQGGKENKVDAIAKGGTLTVTVRDAKGQKEKKSVLVGPGMYLSNTLSLVMATKKPGKEPFAFQAIVEDVRDGNYDPMEGAALISETTKKIHGLDCRKITVEFHGQAEWWVAPNGKVCEINAPVNGTKIELSNEKEAKKALGLK